MFLKKYIKKIIEPIFNIKNKKYLKEYYIQLNKNKNIFNIDEDLKNIKKVLVIAPHQDDETIGLGGTISKLKGNGTIVDLLYLTDGKLLNDNSNISNIRKSEAKGLEKTLYIDNIIFLDNTNDALYDKINYSKSCIKEIINLKEYDACFLTSRFDCHKDHRAAFEMISQLSAENEFKECIIFYLYDINNSIQGKALNCISLLNDKELNEKWNSYELFKSQEYITFSTLKIIDKSKLIIADRFDTSKYKGLECFTRLEKNQMLDISKVNNSFAMDMKTATSSIKLIKFLEFNKRFTEKFNNLSI